MASQIQRSIWFFYYQMCWQLYFVGQANPGNTQCNRGASSKIAIFFVCEYFRIFLFTNERTWKTTLFPQGKVYKNDIWYVFFTCEITHPSVIRVRAVCSLSHNNTQKHRASMFIFSLKEPKRRQNHANLRKKAWMYFLTLTCTSIPKLAGIT